MDEYKSIESYIIEVVKKERTAKRDAEQAKFDPGPAKLDDENDKHNVTPDVKQDTNFQRYRDVGEGKSPEEKAKDVEKMMSNYTSSSKTKAKAKMLARKKTKVDEEVVKEKLDTQYKGNSAQVTGSKIKKGDKARGHDGRVGKVTAVSSTHVHIAGQPYQHADVKKLKTEDMTDMEKEANGIVKQDRFGPRIPEEVIDETSHKKKKKKKEKNHPHIDLSGMKEETVDEMAKVTKTGKIKLEPGEKLSSRQMTALKKKAAAVRDKLQARKTAKAAPKPAAAPEEPQPERKKTDDKYWKSVGSQAASYIQGSKRFPAAMKTDLKQHVTKLINKGGLPGHVKAGPDSELHKRLAHHAFDSLKSARAAKKGPYDPAAKYR